MVRNQETKTGRLWCYVRDDRPFGGQAAPAVLYRYSPDRKGEHPREHLAPFQGIRRMAMEAMPGCTSAV